MAFVGNLSVHSLPEAWGPWEPQYAPPVLHSACIMPIPSLQLKKKDMSHAEKQRVWTPSCGLQELQYTDCAPMWLLQTKFLASVGWKRGCQPFSCPCSLNVTHCRKEICWTCLSKESITAIPFAISKHPLPTRSRFLRATVRSTSSAIMVASCPSLRCSYRKNQSHAEKQRVCTQLWSPRFVTYNTVIVSKIWITGYWLRSQLWHVTDANQWTIVEIELLAAVGWKWGCQPFSCRCSLNVMRCQKEIYGTCWLVSGIHSRYSF